MPAHPKRRPVARRSGRIPLLRMRPVLEKPRVMLIQRGEAICEQAYILKRSARRTIGLQIDGRGLTISAPLWVPVREIEQTILTKFGWIQQKQAEWRAYERARSRAAPRYCNGGHVRFMGKRLTLRTNIWVDRYRRTYFLLAGNELWVAGPHVDDSAWLERKITEWMKEQARQLFEARMQPFVRRLGRGPTEWTISSARSRWGSCGPDGKIMLSWRLIHFPLPIIDYVIAHEISHLREMNHGPRFWATVERLLPGFETAREELRRYPDGLMPG